MTDDISNNELYNKLINIIKAENERLVNTIREEINGKNKILIQKLDECSNRITELEQDHSLLKTRCIGLERQLRKNNIIIFGLDVPPNSDIPTFVINKFKQLLGIDISVTDINNLYQVKNRGKKFIKIEFVTHLKKQLILQNCKKLKGKNISIIQDLCFEDRQDKRILRDHLNKARAKNLFAKIQGHKLVINGDTYTIEQLKHMDTEQNSDNVEAYSPERREDRKIVSAPNTPTIQLYFEDSLSQFRINTPQPITKEKEQESQEVPAIDEEKEEIGKSQKKKEEIVNKGKKEKREADINQKVETNLKKQRAGSVSSARGRTTRQNSKP